MKMDTTSWTHCMTLGSLLALRLVVDARQESLGEGLAQAPRKLADKPLCPSAPAIKLCYYMKKERETERQTERLRQRQRD